MNGRVRLMFADYQSRLLVTIPQGDLRPGDLRWQISDLRRRDTVIGRKL